MARPALATIDDLERLLGAPFSDDEDDLTRIQAEERLAQASEIVRAYAQTDWLNDAEDDVEAVPGAIPGVVTGMVDRASSNPAGVTQEQAGPFARSFGSDAAQRIYLTKMDKLVIRRAVGATGISTIGTSRGAIETGSVGITPYERPEETLTGLHDLLGGS